MLTIEELTTINLRGQVHQHAVSLKTCCKDLLQRIRTVVLRDPDEFKGNCAERERLEGLLDALIDYLAEEQTAEWANNEQGGRP